MLTQEYLKTILLYDENTGLLTWLEERGPTKIGDVAGYINDRGYRSIGIDKKEYRAHRLAWLYMAGNWPEFQIDHKNRKRDDNRWSNLNSVTSLENKKNRCLQSNNSSGINGVVRCRKSNKWIAQIRSNGKYKYLGKFVTKLAAAYARHQANIDYGFSENHGTGGDYV